jgi:hypothetical protein
VKQRGRPLTAVGYARAENNLKTLALMRTRAATEQIDAVYKRVEPVREEKCGRGM